MRGYLGEEEVPNEQRTATALAVAQPLAERPSPLCAVAEPFSKEEAKSSSSHTYFSGDSSFFSLHRALQTIACDKLTGTLRISWTRDDVELLARDGEVVLVTTREPNLYCEEAPVTLSNVERERIDAARLCQIEEGCPIFVTLAREELILHEPALQLVQHYGRKLFAQLWTERVKFAFTQHDLPAYSREMPASEDNIDEWALITLRFVQFQQLGTKELVDTASVPAFTRDGCDRVHELALTVAESQFAAQFNGRRSIAQISKNLRLDIKFARLTLFRFLALEIVECWPAELRKKPKSGRGLRGMFSR